VAPLLEFLARLAQPEKGGGLIFVRLIARRQPCVDGRAALQAEKIVRGD